MKRCVSIPEIKKLLDILHVALSEALNRRRRKALVELLFTPGALALDDPDAMAGAWRYMVDDEAAQRFLAALDQPSPRAEEGLRRLVQKPSVLPEG